MTLCLPAQGLRKCAFGRVRGWPSAENIRGFGRIPGRFGKIPGGFSEKKQAIFAGKQPNSAVFLGARTREEPEGS
jgi:hypothetical protein